MRELRKKEKMLEYQEKIRSGWEGIIMIMVVSEALFYVRRDTLFQDPFWGVSDFSVSYYGYLYFSIFSMWILICWCEKTQEDTLKVCIYQKYLGMQNNKHRGDRI